MKGIVKARDTMIGIPIGLEQLVDIPYKTMLELQDIKREVNQYGIAIIPYCCKCKRSLDWDYDNVNIFCPRCGRVWEYMPNKVKN